MIDSAGLSTFFIIFAPISRGDSTVPTQSQPDYAVTYAPARTTLTIDTSKMARTKRTIIIEYIHRNGEAKTEDLVKLLSSSTTRIKMLLYSQSSASPLYKEILQIHPKLRKNERRIKQTRLFFLPSVSNFALQAQSFEKIWYFAQFALPLHLISKYRGLCKQIVTCQCWCTSRQKSMATARC